MASVVHFTAERYSMRISLSGFIHFQLNADDLLIKSSEKNLHMQIRLHVKRSAPIHTATASKRAKKIAMEKGRRVGVGRRPKQKLMHSNDNNAIFFTLLCLEFCRDSERFILVSGWKIVLCLHLRPEKWCCRLEYMHCEIVLIVSAVDRDGTLTK